MIGKTEVFLLLFSFLYLVSSFPSALGDNFKCKSRNGKFPKPGSSCRSYYLCSNWNPKEKTCPEDQHFFPAKGYCVWPEEYPCLEKPRSKECPLPDGKFLKPGTECKKYYDCCKGRPTEEKCPKGTLFDHVRGKCDWPEYVTCPENPKSKKCPRLYGKFLKPGTGCKNFYECRDGVPLKRKCPSGQLFDPDRETCEWLEIYTCVEDVSTTKSTSHSTSTLSITSTTSTKIVTDSDEDSSSSEENSSEEGNSSEENRQSSTKSETISTSIISSTTSNEYTESTQGEVMISSTQPPSTVESSSTVVSSTAAPDDISTIFEISSASFTDEYVTKTATYPEVVTEETHTEIVTKETYPEVLTEETHTEALTKETQPEVLTEETHTEVVTRETQPEVVTEETHTEVVTEETHTRVTHTIEGKDGFSTTLTSGLTDSVTSHIFCPKPNGHFPHPYDKHKFIACVGGDPIIMNCPNDLVYDHKRRSCEYNTKKRKINKMTKYL